MNGSTAKLLRQVAKQRKLTPGQYRALKRNYTRLSWQEKTKIMGDIRRGEA